MTTFIGLLRAVNVGGSNKVGMAELREMLTGLGLHDARSLLQSGNVVFRSDGHAAAPLEKLLEEAAARQLSLKTDVFVRTASEWKEVIARNPFLAEAKRDPGHLLVIFMKDSPGRAQVTALQGAIQGRETVKAVGRHLYAVYPDGIGRSRLTTALIERKLGARGTGRNWNTLLKLRDLAEAS